MTPTSTDTHRHRTPSVPVSPTRRRALAGVGAVVAALAVWGLADPVAGVDLRITPDGGAPLGIGAGMVAAAATVAALAGWALLELLERVTVRARAVWIGAALVVLAASTFGPFDGATPATTVALLAMHVAVAAVLIPVLAATSPRAGTVAAVSAPGHGPSSLAASE